MIKFSVASIPFFALFFLFSCLPKLEKGYFNLAEERPTAYEKSSKKKKKKHFAMCRKQSNYIPDTNYITHFPKQILRINVHWVNTADSSHVFGKDSIPFNEYRAKWYTNVLIRACNRNYNNNYKLFLPYGNDIPALPINVELQLTPATDNPKDKGIYFHYDEDIDYHIHKGKNRNLYSRTVFDKYAVQLDSVINIFILPHHPDSIASPTYKVRRSGIALRNCVKILGIYDQKVGPTSYRGIIIHELGHLLGLSHAWGNDRCSDTFKHKRKCFSKITGPGCDTMVSNNVMGYNRFQSALSPEQIGRMHKHFSNLKAKQRKFLLPQWCKFQEDKSIHIQDSVNWQCHKDLQGHLIIEKGGSLRIFCRLSMPPNAKIIVQPGGKLILDNCRLHNDCGEKWQGIEIQKRGKEEGEVVIIGEVEMEDMMEGMR